MRPPPGNNGGAVSGAGPCPPAVETQNNTTSASHRPLSYPTRFRNLTSFPLQQRHDSEHTNACSRETTGGQTRCGEAGRPGGRRWAERGNAQRCREQRNRGHGTPKMLPSLRGRRARTIRHAQMKAAQKERASLAWSYSNPDHGGRATSNASTCSTASPVLASSRPRSQMRTLLERLRGSPQRMV
jgi:hypothetical protein